MTISPSTMWISIVALCLASAACDPKDGGGPAQATSASAAATTAPLAAARSPGVAITVGDSAIAANPIGIPACDAYVAAINACYVPKLPPEARDEVLAPMKQLRFAWKERAEGGTADVEKALASECNARLAAEKDRLTAVGCLP